MKRTNDFQSIRSERGLLPPDLLRRVLDPREKLPGTLPEEYGLPKGERLNEAITQSWNRMRKHWAEFRSTEANSEWRIANGGGGPPFTNAHSPGAESARSSVRTGIRRAAHKRGAGSAITHEAGCHGIAVSLSNGLSPKLQHNRLFHDLPH